MKGFMVFLTLALVASANARVPVNDKGIIDDALALKACLEKAVASLQGSIDNVLGTVNTIKSLIDKNAQKLAACQAIGGDSPSLIELIEQATCVIGLVDSIKADVAQVISELQGNLDNLLGAGDLLQACFLNEEVARVPEKGIIDDIIAMKNCLEKAIPAIKNSVEEVLATVNDVLALISTTTEKLDACQAIGGANPSLVDQIKQATCVLALVDSVKADVANVIQEIQTSVNDLLAAGNILESCL